MGEKNITLSGELKEKPEIAEMVNRRLFAVYHLVSVSDVLMSEVEDILSEGSKYSYTIKREHTFIAARIKRLIQTVWKTFDKKEQNDFWEDNVNLHELINVWSGLDKTKFITTNERKKGSNYNMFINPAGDIWLRNQDGWNIQIPKAIADEMSVIKSTYDVAATMPEGMPVDVDFFIRDGRFTKPEKD